MSLAELRRHEQARASYGARSCPRKFRKSDVRSFEGFSGHCSCSPSHVAAIGRAADVGSVAGPTRPRDWSRRIDSEYASTTCSYLCTNQAMGRVVRGGCLGSDDREESQELGVIVVGFPELECGGLNAVLVGESLKPCGLAVCVLEHSNEELDLGGEMMHQARQAQIQFASDVAKRTSVVVPRSEDGRRCLDDVRLALSGLRVLAPWRSRQARPAVPNPVPRRERVQPSQIGDSERAEIAARIVACW